MLIYQGCTVTILNTAVHCLIDCDLICFFFYHILFYYTQLFLILFYVGILNLRKLTFLCKHLNVCLFYFSGIIFDFTLDFTLLLSCIIINWTALFLVVFKFIFFNCYKNSEPWYLPGDSMENVYKGSNPVSQLPLSASICQSILSLPSWVIGKQAVNLFNSATILDILIWESIRIGLVWGPASSGH